MGFIVLLIFLIGIIVVIKNNKKQNNKLPEYFNSNSLQATYQLIFEATVEDIERWLKNGSLPKSHFYEELKDRDVLIIFTWIQDTSEQGKEKLRLLQKFEFDINKTTSSGKNAAMDYIDGMDPLYWFKQESEKNIPEEKYHNADFFTNELLYFKTIGLDFSKLDNLNRSVFYYAFKTIIKKDIKVYPNLLFICDEIIKVFSLTPNLADIAFLLMKDFDVSTGEQILRKYYTNEERNQLGTVFNEAKEKALIDDAKHKLLEKLLKVND